MAYVGTTQAGSPPPLCTRGVADPQLGVSPPPKGGRVGKLLGRRGTEGWQVGGAEVAIGGAMASGLGKRPLEVMEPIMERTGEGSATAWQGHVGLLARAFVEVVTSWCVTCLCVGSTWRSIPVGFRPYRYGPTIRQQTSDCSRRFAAAWFRFVGHASWKTGWPPYATRCKLPVLCPSVTQSRRPW